MTGESFLNRIETVLSEKEMNSPRLESSDN